MPLLFANNKVRVSRIEALIMVKPGLPGLRLATHLGMDRVISELCHKEKNLQRNYRKMTISWTFSYNSFIKFHG